MLGKTPDVKPLLIKYAKKNINFTPDRSRRGLKTIATDVVERNKKKHKLNYC